MKKITVEKVILFLAAGFAAYNFGLAGGYIEGTHYSAGGLVAGVVVNVSLAIASSRYGSLKGDKRTKQAKAAFMVMLLISPLLVSPVVFYSLPETFLGHWALRAVWAVAWPLVADLAIVLAGAVSGKGLIALSDDSALQSASSASGTAYAVHGSAQAVHKHKPSSASAVLMQCEALSRKYACTVEQCAWSPDAVEMARQVKSGKNPVRVAVAMKAGHSKNNHPKPALADALFQKATGEKP